MLSEASWLKQQGHPEKCLHCGFVYGVVGLFVVLCVCGCVGVFVYCFVLCLFWCLWWFGVAFVGFSVVSCIVVPRPFFSFSFSLGS